MELCGSCGAIALSTERAGATRCGVCEAGLAGARKRAGPLADGLTVQVRHRGARIPADVTVGAEVHVALAEPVTAAPGQAAVIYAGDRVIGGGWIARPRTA